MKYIALIGLFILLGGCGQDYSKRPTDPLGEKLMDRILAPEGYEWIIEEPGSFGEFLQNAVVKIEGSPILDFNNQPISNQFEHIAVLDFDIGNKNLQQCADAVIRLRAEYLYQYKKFGDISFQFTNGDSFSWSDYKKGIRPQLISSNKVEFKRVARRDGSYQSFRNYLDVVFIYAGTISLFNETIRVTDNKKIKAGDFLITPGSPGHAVAIVGRAKNKKEEIIYLLAEGYTPAQSIHVITNPFHRKISPWYKLDVAKKQTITARYVFKKTNIRTFKD